jgi:hypothetical protein
MVEPSLGLLQELQERTLREVRGLRDEIHDLRDDLLVQGAILLRLEQRERSPDRELLALQQQIQRLQRRVDQLEKE